MGGGAEMEYCVSATRMLAEKICQIAERFGEVPQICTLNLKNVVEMFQMINNVGVTVIS